MKTIYLLAFFAAFSLRGFAQMAEHWTVQLNSKTLLTANSENEAANTIKVKELKKGSLIVTYVPGEIKGQRKRKLMVYDTGDNELYSTQSLSLVLPVKTLKKWRETLPQIKIYTVPVLDDGGAAVRLRRVHLCTIRFD